MIQAVDVTKDPELSAKLITDATNLDRMHDLDTPGAWEFDFTKQEKYTFSPGSVVNANAATFPALTKIGMTLAQLNLGPCAMLAPHWHPRGTNLVIAVSGNTTTYMVAENGAKPVITTLTPGRMTVFPQASLHTMQNNGCENAQLISALDTADTGTTNVLNAMFDNIPQEILAASFGIPDFNVEEMKKGVAGVGTGSVMGSYECQKRCGIEGGKTNKAKRVVDW
ncbi:RmlC-like cupin domain-containing protein [Lophiotrema nucula]|uniref:RmlC-like cupin domain-containing protein n=1 Tax=Lophiotrema nucula TaxID=690887 RepID=A0A6A5Z980_9PLEO|nr:RmlC-like cupin domain-containing protein [Lophiotrema nucula]